MYIRLFACTMLMWSLSIVSCNPRDSNSEQDTSSSVTANVDPARFGLFIGINQYKDSEISDLSGCVRDATRLRDIFVKRFRFQEVAFLCDEQATREGIAAGFRKLVSRVEAFRNKEKEENKDQQTVWVVVTYSGHGYRVRNQNSQDDPEKDGLDSTWSPHDTSSMSGDGEIRDDDIYLVWLRLTEDFRANVLLISDSCHSGSIHRGMSTQARSRWMSGSEIFDGPSEDLFPEYARRRRGQDDNGTDLARFVKYSACLDSEYALEDPQGGYFTLSLCEVLPTVGPKTTYEEVHEHAVKFLQEVWGTPQWSPQHPQFSSNVENNYFLSGEKAVSHATVVPGSIEPGRAILTMGSIDGVTKESRFEFFNSVSDLVQRKSTLGFGIVSEVAPFTCHVEFDDRVKIDYTSKALLDRVRLLDFKVKCTGDVPIEVTESLEKLVSEKAIILVNEDETDYNVLVCPIPDEDHTLGIYSPRAEPGYSLDGSIPKSLRKILSEEPEKLANLLSNNLLYLGRVTRLMSLDYASDRLSTDVIAYRRNNQDQLEEVQRPKKDGIRVLKDKDLFTITVENHLHDQLYLTVLFMKENGDLVVLYPQRGDPGDIVVQPERGIEIGRVGRGRAFTASLDPDEDFSRMFVKVIATNRKIDLRSLVIPPQTGIRGRFPTDRGPLYDLFADIIHGGFAQSRGSIGREVLPETWAAKSIFVDVKSDSQ